MTNLEIIKKLIKDKGIIEVNGKKHEAGYTYLNHLLTEDIKQQLLDTEKEFIKKFMNYLVIIGKTPWNIKIPKDF